ncbi:hypothetical protein Pelo_15599 [Pelomyxa schiedti]|nr:hypothetical protein Pelo_15599 [Pelomyxa schiedti]
MDGGGAVANSGDTFFGSGADGADDFDFVDASSSATTTFGDDIESAITVAEPNNDNNNQEGVGAVDGNGCALQQHEQQSSPPPATISGAGAGAVVDGEAPDGIAQVPQPHVAFDASVDGARESADAVLRGLMPCFDGGDDDHDCGRGSGLPPSSSSPAGESTSSASVTATGERTNGGEGLCYHHHYGRRDTTAGNLLPITEPAVVARGDMGLPTWATTSQVVPTIMRAMAASIARSCSSLDTTVKQQALRRQLLSQALSAPNTTSSKSPCPEGAVALADESSAKRRVILRIALEHAAYVGALSALWDSVAKPALYALTGRISHHRHKQIQQPPQHQVQLLRGNPGFVRAHSPPQVNSPSTVRKAPGVHAIPVEASVAPVGGGLDNDTGVGIIPGIVGSGLRDVTISSQEEALEVLSEAFGYLDGLKNTAQVWLDRLCERLCSCACGGACLGLCEGVYSKRKKASVPVPKAESECCSGIGQALLELVLPTKMHHKFSQMHCAVLSALRFLSAQSSPSSQPPSGCRCDYCSITAHTAQATGTTVLQRVSRPLVLFPRYDTALVELGVCCTLQDETLVAATQALAPVLADILGAESVLLEGGGGNNSSAPWCGDIDVATGTNIPPPSSSSATTKTATLVNSTKPALAETTNTTSTSQQPATTTVSVLEGVVVGVGLEEDDPRTPISNTKKAT